MADDHGRLRRLMMTTTVPMSRTAASIGFGARECIDCILLDHVPGRSWAAELFLFFFFFLSHLVLLAYSEVFNMGRCMGKARVRLGYGFFMICGISFLVFLGVWVLSVII